MDQMTSRAMPQRLCWEAPLRRLKASAILGPGDEEVLKQALTSHDQFAADVTVDLAPRQLLILASGWACRLQVLPNGRRQILGLILPGDPIRRIDRPHGHRTLSVRSITAIQTCEATDMLDIDDAGRPRYVSLYEAARKIQGAVDGFVFDHVVRLGALNAYERVGDLFLEVFNRLNLVGLTNGDQFLMPLTQERLGEMLGLSETHINRTIRQLRQDGLLSVGPGWFALPDRGRLESCVGRAAPNLIPA